MKYSKWIGLAAALAIIAVCYMPWVYVPQVPLEIGGMYASAKHNFGKPGLMNCILCVVAMVMFLTPFIWAKRTNIFICAFNIAWAVRDYFLLSRCYGGECPEKRAGLYLLVFLSLIMLVMSFLPDIEIKEKKS